MTVFDPRDLDCDGFVVGPCLDVADLDVDRIFGKQLEVALKEVTDANPAAFAATGRHPDTTCEADPSLVFRSVECGLVLLAGETVVGGVVEVDIVLRDDYQGRGIGVEMVLECFMREGEFPFWHLDTPAFSPRGLATMRSAWRLAADREIFERKALALSPRSEIQP